MALPDASTKLRMVLDYVPCEACLAHPVDDQDLLCGICARLDRQVAVRVGTRTNVLVERPSPPAAPVVISAAPPELDNAPAPPPVLSEIVVRFAADAPVQREGAIEVVVEPLEPPAPVAAATTEPERPSIFPIAAPPELVLPQEEPEFVVDDLYEYTKARDEFFDFKKGPTPTPRAPEPERAEPPAAVYAPAPEPAPQDDFVFRPPQAEPAAAERAPEPAAQDDIIPVEEVPVEAAETQARWAPPADPTDWDRAPDFLADEEPAPPAEEDPIVEMELVEEDEVLEMELVPEDDEVVEMEIIPDDEPAAPAAVTAPARAAAEAEGRPTGSGDLYRLRGFDANAEMALARSRIAEIAHLSGHDAGELAHRTGIPLSRMQAWIQVADLVQEVGVPVEAAVALVAAGVAGPKGLRDADADEVADRVTAFGGYTVKPADVKRWKRRA